jgi:hypothetical protein
VFSFYTDTSSRSFSLTEKISLKLPESYFCHFASPNHLKPVVTVSNIFNSGSIFTVELAGVKHSINVVLVGVSFSFGMNCGHLACVVVSCQAGVFKFVNEIDAGSWY